MKIYVASSWRNNYQPGVVTVLRQDGHQVYDFKGPGDGWGGAGEVDPDWQNWPQDIPRYIAGLNHPRAIEGFRRDMDALEASDACVMVAPCGPSASMEMGWACGSGRFVAVYMPEIRERDLMVKMADYVGQDLEEIRRLLVMRSGRIRSREQRDVVSWFQRNGGESNAIGAFHRALNEVRELKYAIAERNLDHAAEESARSMTSRKPEAVRQPASSSGGYCNWIST